MTKDLKSLSLTNNAKLTQSVAHQAGTQEVPISILTLGNLYADFFALHYLIL